MILVRTAVFGSFLRITFLLFAFPCCADGSSPRKTGRKPNQWPSSIPHSPDQYWPNEDPLGQHIGFGGDSPWMTIVGIVAHAKSSSLEADVKEGFYFLPFAQSPNPGGEIVVRTDSAHPENLAGAMQAAIRRVDPNQPLYDLKTMEQRVDTSLVGRRFPGCPAFNICRARILVGGARSLWSDQLFGAIANP